ncbi:ABC transporter substrate-binding protein [Rhodococcus sp. CC-R104]|uniref:ABC transporter substrate-binding protein n=2 Tax=Rhodococcus chondri TaxID=3065941 RepID=A0ABU7JZ62_9NOCA|nr:ABC transporter substrate-binding protein [Rhodococcus sp. CC-R104]
MYRPRRFLPAVAAACATALLLVSCSGSSSDDATGAQGPAGDPVAGGSLDVLQTGEPRSLDPAALTNYWAFQPTLGNALYGTLMINDVDTLEIEYKMATDFSTTDGGATFTLKLQPDLTFTDGTPLDAAAVKYNWDRLVDPKLGSTSGRWAAQIAETRVEDPTTLRVVMRSPNPHYAQSIVGSSLNWIASPAALEKGPAAFDENPVGAGPFTLASWTRQDAVELTKNPDYWDAPKPYLDSITIRTVSDTNQRVNAVTTGAADLASETNWESLKKIEAAGLNIDVVPTGGGQFVAMNFARAPFADERARRAVSLAVDLDAINTAVYNGEGEIPMTLFEESSPFFSEIALKETDPEAAQKLFDELAAEGKPVSFTFLSYPTTESKMLGEALQAQMSAFDNVEAKVDVVDYAQATARTGARDFDMLISSAVIQDPDNPLWLAFHSDSSGNSVGVDDAELSAALDAGRTGRTVEERKAAYETVQERLVQLNPGIWYYRAVPAVVWGDHVQGVEVYTLGSPLPEEIWVTD